MRVIPVLDLMAGQVVAARRGDRAAYRPIETPLAPSADPVAVAGGLLALHPFSTLYIADLDAIEGRAANADAVAAIRRRWPDLEIWLDAGVVGAAAALDLMDRSGVRCVVGTESRPDPADLRALGDRVVLSLDFRGNLHLGPAAILDDPGLWPRDVVAMTLASVGAGAGPDLDRLDAIASRLPERSRLFAAGGVRHGGDLLGLATRGIAGALVASALHQGALTPDDLDALGTRPTAERNRGWPTATP